MIKPCDVCGKPFKPWQSKMLYCSGPCALEGGRQKQQVRDTLRRKTNAKARALQTCPHCKCRHNYKWRRGMCKKCFNDPEVRALYPKRIRQRHYHEPTEEELDALIAEQMRPENLPSWWPKHGERDGDE